MYDNCPQPEFIHIPPFRFVKPYPYTYATNVKSRWVGRTLLEAMTNEFRAYTQEYYENAINEGKIMVNGVKVNTNYILNQGMKIEHFTTRVEPPVLDLPIQIVYEDDQFVVVNKPPSMIVHTGGGYHYNCLAAILHYEHNYKNLYVLHRLDRLTSGLLLFSKQKELAQKFHDANSKFHVQKTYLARVQGDFNYDKNDRPQYCISMKDAIFSCCSEEDAQKLEAKNAITLFSKIWYDPNSNSSLVECKPITGRTHQIRVHLADLNHPILNDIGYGGKFVGNEIISKHWKGLKQETIRQQDVLEGDVDDKPKKKVKVNETENKFQEVIQKDELNNNKEKELQQVEKQKNEYQLHQTQYGNENLLKDCIAGKEEWDYHKHPLEIYLHSWKYQFNDQEFISPQPYWFEK